MIEIEFSEGILRAQGLALDLEWASGRRQHLSAAFLRSRCACASCREIKFELSPEMFPGLEILKADLVGNYAFQFYFSDGHKHGAYPYATLQKFPDQA